jgi:predicted secreted protein
MDQSAFVKRLYAILAVGACVLMALVLVLMKGGLSQQGFAVSVLIWWIAMFAAVFPLIRSRQRSAEETRKKEVDGGVPADAIDREQCVRTIRSLKKLIAVFAVFLGYGLLATRGGPLLPRAVGAAVDVFFLAAFVHSLIRAQKRLKELPPDPATGA